MKRPRKSRRPSKAKPKRLSVDALRRALAAGPAAVQMELRELRGGSDTPPAVGKA